LGSKLKKAVSKPGPKTISTDRKKPMKAIQLEKPEHLRLIDIAEPQKPVANDVLVAIRCIGICGTDYSGYLGKFPFFSVVTPVKEDTPTAVSI
jgi:NADPH:quinone reductase-like Zn-dependent oxidoreductase